MKKQNKTKVLNVTPERHRCLMTACPTIFKTEDGKYIIVGRILSAEELIEEVKKKVGEGEIAIEIPASLIDELSD